MSILFTCACVCVCVCVCARARVCMVRARMRACVCGLVCDSVHGENSYDFGGYREVCVK